MHRPASWATVPSTLLDVATTSVAASATAARGLVSEAARTVLAARRVLLRLDELLESGLLDELAEHLRELATQAPPAPAGPARRPSHRPDPVMEPTLFG